MDNFIIDLSVNKDVCVGCTLCVRACPVNAITMVEKKAVIDTHKCISCGKCAVVCPTNAISFPSDVKKVISLLQNNEKVFLMVAPSFVVHYGSSIPELLLDWRSCGFDKIAEITYGAKLVTKKYQELLDEGKEHHYVTSTCPVTFDFIFKFDNQNIPAVAPVVSPMVAMSLAVKKHFPRHKTLFVGPCPAKVVEAREYDCVDAALTFLEFDKIVKEYRDSDVVVATEKNKSFDNFYNNRNKIYPRSGGLSRIMVEHGVLQENQYIAKDGVLDIHDLFSHDTYPKGLKFFDVLFCPGGCIGGPGLKSVLSTDEKMQLVDEYRAKTKKSDKEVIDKFHFDLEDEEYDLKPCFCKK